MSCCLLGVENWIRIQLIEKSCGWAVWSDNVTAYSRLTKDSMAVTMREWGPVVPLAFKWKKSSQHVSLVATTEKGGLHWLHHYNEYGSFALKDHSD